MTRKAVPGPAGPGDLAGLLADGAAGLLAEAAAVQLLAGDGCWLSRTDFTGPFIAAGPSPLSGQPLAHVRWKAAARALAGASCPPRAPSRPSSGSPPAWPPACRSASVTRSPGWTTRTWPPSPPPSGTPGGCHRR